MMLYVNGDSHTAAAEAVNPHAFAEDDSALFYLGRAPHPDNLAVSWGRSLATTLKSVFRCDAESASSNSRIVRTTLEWLAGAGRDFSDQLVVIQWSTWEREEWVWDGKYYQIGASGLDWVPAGLEPRYKEFIVNVDWRQKAQQAHEEIWQFHLDLKRQKIRHIFFNGNNDFSSIKEKYDWGTNYIAPYDPTMTYDAIIRSQGIETVIPGSWHFGRDGHSAFHRFILNYIINNKFV
jgi:hypothetical protein